MDLALKEEDQEFAASFRSWLGENLRRPPAFADLADEVAWGKEWQATLAADRWVGVHWPSSYGGRSATPVQVALYQSEYARAQAPQPVPAIQTLRHSPRSEKQHGNARQSQRVHRNI